MLTAILFQVFGALFGSNLLSLANAFDKRETLHTSRLVLLIVFYIGSAVSIMGGQAIGANRELRNNREKLTDEQAWVARKSVFVLACGQ